MTLIASTPVSLCTRSIAVEVLAAGPEKPGTGHRIHFVARNIGPAANTFKGCRAIAKCADNVVAGHSRENRYMPGFRAFVAYLREMLVAAFENKSSFHHHIDVLQQADVRQRIAAGSNQVTVASRGNRSNIFVPTNGLCGD